ncbi:MAG: DnaA regulatory inactivator Hda [Gammaproteobacteria bacterium]|nr:DnaA regulatory inactivator Hda [Gammaproteobacteria bacterium]
MSRQEPLALRLEAAPGFDNFIPAGNEEVLALLRGLAQKPQPGFTSIWGPPASGKSHLLQALCNQASESGVQAVYLPLSQLQQSDPAELEIFAEHPLICLDELDCLSQSRPWQEALYRLYNALQQAGACLVSASRVPPRQLPLQLADLASRLSWGPCYQLQPLDDPHKARLLQQRALERGLQLPDEAAQYLLNRQQRDLASLLEILERLDQASLIAQRRLTLPFIREQLS